MGDIMTRTIFLDIETDNLNPYNVQLISCMVTVEDGVSKWWHASDEFRRDGTIADGIEYLNSANAKLVGHNIQLYDFPVLYRFGLKRPHVMIDTLLLSRLVFPFGKKPMGAYIHPDTITDKVKYIKDCAKVDRDADDDEEDNKFFISHGLAAWGQRLGDYKKDVNKDFLTVRQELLEYCEQDVRLTEKIYNLACDRFQDMSQSEFDELIKLNDFNSCVGEAVSTMCANGVMIDKQALMELVDELHMVTSSCLVELKQMFQAEFVDYVIAPTKKEPNRIKAVITEFNPNSNTLLHRALKTKYPDFEPVAYTDKGSPSFKADNMDIMALIYDELKMVSHYRDLLKRTSSIVGKGVQFSGKGYLDNVKNSRLHGVVSAIGTRTWRATHSLPNLGQTTSKRKIYGEEIRKAFIVPEGYKFVGFDISNLEVCALAEMVYRITGRKELMNQVIQGDKSKGTDTHSLNAASLTRAFNKDIDRDTAKTMFLAFLYGAGTPKLGVYLDSTANINTRAELGKRAMEVMSNTCPGLVATRDYVITEYLLNGYTTLIDGHKVIPTSPHSCLNMQGQGLGAIISKAILVGVYQDIINHHCPRTEVMPILWVHDEFHFQVREDLVDDFVRKLPKLCKNSVRYLNLTVPIEIEVKVGTSWADAH